MTGTTISDIRTRVNYLTEIPANEQCIGHLQVAVQAALLDILEHLDKLEKVAGITHA